MSSGKGSGKGLGSGKARAKANAQARAEAKEKAKADKKEAKEKAKADKKALKEEGLSQDSLAAFRERYQKKEESKAEKNALKVGRKKVLVTLVKKEDAEFDLEDLNVKRRNMKKLLEFNPEKDTKITRAIGTLYGAQNPRNNIGIYTTLRETNEGKLVLGRASSAVVRSFAERVLGLEERDLKKPTIKASYLAILKRLIPITKFKTDKKSGENKGLAKALCLDLSDTGLPEDFNKDDHVSKKNMSRKMKKNKKKKENRFSQLISDENFNYLTLEEVEIMKIEIWHAVMLICTYSNDDNKKPLNSAFFSDLFNVLEKKNQDEIVRKSGEKKASIERKQARTERLKELAKEKAELEKEEADEEALLKIIEEASAKVKRFSESENPESPPAKKQKLPV